MKTGGRSAARFIPFYPIPARFRPNKRPNSDQTEAMSPMAIAFTTACTLFVAFSFSKTLFT